MNHRLAPILQRYFTSYALTQRALSPATIRTYRDCWALLLTFVAERTQLPAHALELAHIDHRCVTEFLDHLENERGNSIATRNLRLAAIKAVLTFECATRPEHLDTIAAVQAIPVKKHPRPQLSYLTATQVQALLDAIDTTTWTGRRDQAMFTLAAHTGLRVSELISLNVDSEVFSVTACMLELGEYERCFDDGSDSFGAQGDPVERLPAGGEQRGGPFAETPKSGQQRVAAGGVGVEDVAVGRNLRRGVNTDAGALVALVREGGKALSRGGVQGACDPVFAGGRQIVGVARQCVGDPQRKSVRSSHELDVRAESAVLARVPQVDRGAPGTDGGLGDPVAGDEGAVEDHVGVARREARAQDLGQLRRLGGEHVDALVQIPVGGGDRDTGVTGQGGERRVLAEPAQHEHRLAKWRQGTAAASGTSLAPAGVQQSGQILGERSRDIERGRIGDHVEPLVRIRSSQIQSYQGLCVLPEPA